MRYPFALLEALVLADVGPQLHPDGQPVGVDRRVAAQLGTSPRQIRRWRSTGVDAAQADRLALAAGFHPLEVWPELAELDHRPCQARGCTSSFVPYRSNQKWCSQRCSRRERARRRYHRDPVFAAAENERSRVYHAECGEYVRAQARARWARRSEAA